MISARKLSPDQRAGVAGRSLFKTIAEWGSMKRYRTPARSDHSNMILLVPSRPKSRANPSGKPQIAPVYNLLP
ncbi:MAG: hypothetical protein AAGC92_02420 [Pseudomonadota bacterium]